MKGHIHTPAAPRSRNTYGFTMIELMVAVGILAMMVAFASIIFNFSTDAYRVAAANAEIMQKFRAITAQIENDFKGLRRDAPLFIWFERDETPEPNRFDQIMFFANGDFSAIQLYTTSVSSNREPLSIYDINDLQSTKIVKGTTARIYYGLAQSNTKPPQDQDETERILARRMHILTDDDTLIQWPESDFSDFDEIVNGKPKNDRYEHDSLSLTEWLAADATDYENYILPTTFDEPPLVDMDDPSTFHLLLAESVGSFSVQWAYWHYDSGQRKWYLRWFPDHDMRIGEYTINHFLNGLEFGAYFNVPGAIGNWYWKPPYNIEYYRGMRFASDFYPDALKFTFRIYDSKGVIKGGRTFTYIVYLND